MGILIISTLQRLGGILIISTRGVWGAGVAPQDEQDVGWLGSIMALRSLHAGGVYILFYIFVSPVDEVTEGETYKWRCVRRPSVKTCKGG